MCGSTTFSFKEKSHSNFNCFCIQQGNNDLPGCTLYVNSTCQQVLRQTKSCLSDGEEENISYVMISGNIDHQKNEITLQRIKYIFDALGASQACVSSLIPFMCQYLFPLCDGNGTVHKPSRNQCIEISSAVCRDEWKSAINILNLKDYLPDCQHLPETSLCNNGNMHQPLGLSSFSVLSTSADNTYEIQSINDSEVQCNDQFYLSNGTCLPLCDKLNFYSDELMNNSLIIESIAAIIFGIVLLISTCIWRNKM